MQVPSLPSLHPHAAREPTLFQHWSQPVLTRALSLLSTRSYPLSALTVFTSCLSALTLPCPYPHPTDTLLFYSHLLFSLMPLSLPSPHTFLTLLSAYSLHAVSSLSLPSCTNSEKRAHTTRGCKELPGVGSPVRCASGWHVRGMCAVDRCVRGRCVSGTCGGGSGRVTGL